MVRSSCWFAFCVHIFLSINKLIFLARCLLYTGDMPAFSWLEPNYFEAPNIPASDQHPDHDVSIGDQLIKDVYDAVRASPLWEKTALIITYDEHGGFFDHVPPPMNVPNPDGMNSTDDPFDFTRLGKIARIYFLLALSCQIHMFESNHTPRATK